jgi:Holliday junction resolvase RusA-like endonuclease
MATYIIMGDPISVMRPRNLNQHYWDSLKRLKHSAINQLENQLNEQKPFERPVHIDFRFYFTPPGPHKPLNPHGFNHSKPDISDLIKFVENVATGILLKDPNIISSISSFKRYSDSPRTEIIITELLHE